MILFFREWRHFSYEPKSVTFTNGTESTSYRDDMHSVTLPQFSSASVPQVSENKLNSALVSELSFCIF
jgi:general transcription factor 3C polypeptide 2